MKILRSVSLDPFTIVTPRPSATASPGRTSAKRTGRGRMTLDQRAELRCDLLGRVLVREICGEPAFRVHHVDDARMVHLVAVLGRMLGVVDPVFPCRLRDLFWRAA